MVKPESHIRCNNQRDVAMKIVQQLFPAMHRMKIPTVVQVYKLCTQADSS